eukprot:1607875-Prymnesium_polylepis.1
MVINILLCVYYAHDELVRQHRLELGLADLLRRARQSPASSRRALCPPSSRRALRKWSSATR